MSHLHLVGARRTRLRFRFAVQATSRSYNPCGQTFIPGCAAPYELAIRLFKASLNDALRSHGWNDSG